ERHAVEIALPLRRAAVAVLVLALDEDAILAAHEMQLERAGVVGRLARRQLAPPADPLAIGEAAALDPALVVEHAVGGAVVAAVDPRLAVVDVRRAAVELARGDDIRDAAHREIRRAGRGGRDAGTGGGEDRAAPPRRAIAHGLAPASELGAQLGGRL